jgi:hypothetical protein
MGNQIVAIRDREAQIVVVAKAMGEDGLVEILYPLRARAQDDRRFG